MRVDGRDITVSGSLLQPLTRRTNDILRLVLAAVFLAAVITSSLITRYEWVALEKSISEIVGVLTPTQSNLVYLVYGVAILALPFAILIGLIVARQWKLLGAYAAAAFIAFISLSITGNGISAPRWHFDVTDRLDTLLSQFLDDPRWIAMLAAVLTVSGPWLPVALEAVVVGAAACLCADPPRRQRGGARPLAVGPCGRLVRRRAGCACGRDASPRGAARRRRPRPDPAWIRSDGTERGAPRRAGAAGASAALARSRSRRPWSSCTARISAVVVFCASSGVGCGCATAKPHRYSPPCGALSSTAR